MVERKIPNRVQCLELRCMVDKEEGHRHRLLGKRSCMYGGDPELENWVSKRSRGGELGFSSSPIPHRC